ncbi:ASKHA domain-containing protein [Pseudonocardia sp. H11422]|uniref:ASKHA domain-containing protein n=1 Tax=Pseudonocardia sp. H11422 TaxID=2835866 RepID=UPI001BDC0F72|nr:ASKHA domain-containing protein [Pseudonocardia sp. H11422]
MSTAGEHHDHDRDAWLREGLLGAHPPAGEWDRPGADPGAARVSISFAPDGGTEHRVRVPAGVTVFDAASWNGIAVDSTCGGHGTCKKCRVRVAGDNGAEAPVSRLDPRAFSPDELRAGWRLACLAPANTDIRVEVPPLVTRPKAATVGVGRQVILRPAVQKRCVELAEPTLADQQTDLERLLAALDDLDLRVDLHAVRALPRVLRASEFRVTAVVVDDVLIDVEPGDTTDRRFGIAFDLGTTTVVATLLDLSTGTPQAVGSVLNAQQPFGADVITRISATMLDPDALGRLTERAHATLDELAQEVCHDARVAPAEVYEIALAGNVTMTQLALGIDPEPVGVAPFVMAARSFPGVRAADVGVRVHPGARAYVFPALGAYVGGDIVAGMLASGMDRDRRVRLFIDVGTNCEIVLSDGDRLLATAAPAGPAFEGAAIRCGMRAAPGAIEGVRISDEDVSLQVIGDVEPVGLCGSGLVDVVAALVDAGLVDGTGRLADAVTVRSRLPRLGARLAAVGEERVFVLHRSGEDGDLTRAVYLSQRDIRELQFAKAAITTGWRLLVEEMGLSAGDVQQVLLAGSFGSYLSPAGAVRIGLVPEVSVLRIVSAGNVAGEGAKMALLSMRERAGARTLLEEVRYVELSDRPDFNDRFIDQLAFPT